MKRELPQVYNDFLGLRPSLLKGTGLRSGLSLRGFWVGTFLSLYLAIGAPYVRMAMRSSPLAFDFNTPGAIFLFLVLIGLLNVLFKIIANNKFLALGLSVVSTGFFLFYYSPLTTLDMHSPAVMLNIFIVVSF